MFLLPGLIKICFLIHTLKSWALNACPRAFTPPCHCQEYRKGLPWSKGAVWWHFSHGPVQWFSKAATKKTNKKSSPIITSKHIDLESKCSKQIILTCPSSCRDPWRSEWHSKHRDLRKSLNPRGLAKYYRQFSLVPVAVRNKERWQLRRPIGKKCGFFFSLHTSWGDILWIASETKKAFQYSILYWLFDGLLLNR